MDSTGISVVIRALNAARTLPDVLAGLKLGPQDELILVDSGSTDDTLAIAQKAGARILQIPQAKFTYGYALNVGFAAARNEWIHSLSSHCIPMPVRGDHLGLMREAIAGFDGSVAAAVGPFHNDERDRVLCGGITFFRLEDLPYGFGFPAGNPNCVYRRSRWREHAFDETMGASEDFEWYAWAMGCGWRVAAVHAASVRYANARPMKALYQRGRLDRRYGRRFQHVPKARAREVVIQAVRLCALWALRRASFATVKNGIAYRVGAWVEDHTRQPASPCSSASSAAAIGSK